MFKFYRRPYQIGRLPSGTRCAYLIPDGWNDFGFVTMHSLHVFDERGEHHNLGNVKFGKFGLIDHTVRLPDEFERLESSYFSLGQDAAYYRDLWQLSEELRSTITMGLRDVVADHDLFLRAEGEEVMQTSLLRYVRPLTVTGQFRRVLRGGAINTPYNFGFLYDTAQQRISEPPDRLDLTFEVIPDSLPPSNVHAIIGTNGSGKTTMLREMWRTALGVSQISTRPNRSHFYRFDEDDDNADVFANVISIAFSAFDATPDANMLHESRGDRSARVHVGLYYQSEGTPHGDVLMKSPTELSKEYSSSLLAIATSPERHARWLSAITVLAAEPGFADVATDILDESEQQDTSYFSRLSSGHRIVLLSVARLVEMCGERTLVLIDEPESHLHPPLLSGLVRALSEILSASNSVGIVVTHSPVVLQEVPRDCVWVLSRSGTLHKAERPSRETFGESLDTLTSEVFGLAIASTGFHRMLLDAAKKADTYDEVMFSFGGGIGTEGRALLSAHFANRDRIADA